MKNGEQNRRRWTPTPIELIFLAIVIIIAIGTFMIVQRVPAPILMAYVQAQPENHDEAVDKADCKPDRIALIKSRRYRSIAAKYCQDERSAEQDQQRDIIDKRLQESAAQQNLGYVFQQTKISALQVFLSTATAFAAFVAAWAAHRAAKISAEALTGSADAVRIASENAQATRDLADATRIATENQSRAWLSLTPTISEISRHDKTVGVVVSLAIKNTGSTPARDVGFSIVSTVFRSLRVGAQVLPNADVQYTPVNSLLGNDSIGFDQTLNIKVADIDAVKAASHPSNTIMIQLDIVARYRTVIDTEQSSFRLASARFTVHAGGDRKRTWLDSEGRITGWALYKDKMAPTYLT